MKTGTKVFDIIRQEWGEVVRIKGYGEYPLLVVFNEKTETYTKEGRALKNDNLPRLSLTEFNYITGEGKFTPIDQEPPIEVGDMVYGYDNEFGSVCYGRLIIIDDYKCLAPYVIEINNKRRRMKFISKTRPEWIP